MKKGFSLIEVMLAIGMIFILGSIVIVAINPSEQLEKMCEENPSKPGCENRIEKQQCIDKTRYGCCVEAHDEKDSLGNPQMMCDKYVPLTQ